MVKILIERNDDNELSILYQVEEKFYKFDYVNMIRYLYKHKRFEEVIYKGNISEEEKSKINNMFDEIYKAIEVA